MADSLNRECHYGQLGGFPAHLRRPTQPVSPEILEHPTIKAYDAVIASLIESREIFGEIATKAQAIHDQLTNRKR